jgi:hypothetical protein
MIASQAEQLLSNEMPPRPRLLPCHRSLLHRLHDLQAQFQYCFAQERDQSRVAGRLPARTTNREGISRQRPPLEETIRQLPATITSPA